MVTLDDQDLVDCYIKALRTERFITQDEIDVWVQFHTIVEHAQYQDGGKYQIRMKTHILDGRPPICQYVMVDCDGEMEFWQGHPWFVPGDLLFETFGEALEYVIDAKIVAKEASKE